MGLSTQFTFVASVALAFGLAAASQSLAGCGGYCEARQARLICHQAVKNKGLRAHERDAEFARCRADPASYLELGQAANNAGMNVE